MVHHYSTIYQNKLILQLGANSNIEFVCGEFATDDDEIAKKIELTNHFKLGRIEKIDGEIAKEKSRRGRPKLVQGARGTDVNKEQD